MPTCQFNSQYFASYGKKTVDGHAVCGGWAPDWGGWAHASEEWAAMLNFLYSNWFVFGTMK